MISLTQLTAMNQDKEMAAKWLSENVDAVLEDLNKLHNVSLEMALIYGILNNEGSDELTERVDKVNEVLLRNA